MPETYASLYKQIAEIEDNLRAIEDRLAEFVSPTDPANLQLVRDKGKLEVQLADLRARNQRLREIPCPYRGLEYFDTPHAENYFGRAAMVEKLLERLRQANFVAVVGPSGCGKSSLVRAGLLPALSRSALPGSAAWQVEIFRPGDDPLRALALALVNRLDPKLSAVDRLAEARKLADGLQSGALPVTDVLAQIRAQSPDAPRLLLIADQFEEAFTLCADDEARRTFLDTLLAIAEAPSATVLFTLRADFYERVLEGESFGKRVDAGLVNVLPMSRDERLEAVEQPALRTGCHFEEGLVKRILDAVEDAPGDLPLLEFALTELWERQTADGALTHAAYDAIGEVRGAIAKRADEALAGLDVAQQAVVRAIFTRLVQVARPDEAGQDARRRIDLAELPPESQALAQRLADARLLVTGRDLASGDETVEVAHEALIRGWGQLQEWLNRDREFLLWRQRLRTQAEIWEESGRSEGALLRGALLREAQVRSEGREEDLSTLEWDYVRRSLRSARLDRMKSITRNAVIVTGMLLAGMLLWQMERVRRQNSGITISAAVSLIADDKEIDERIGWALKAYEDQNNLDDDMIAGILEGLHLVTVASTEAEAAEGLSVEAALRSALKDAPAAVLHRFWNDAPPIEVREIIASPDGRRLATLALPEDSLGLTPALWDWDLRGQQAELHPKVIAPVIGGAGLVFNDDGSTVAGIGEDGKVVYLWNTRDGVVQHGLPHETDVAQIWPGPVGSDRLATATFDQQVHLWDTSNGRLLWSFTASAWRPQLAFSEDGGLIAIALDAGSLGLMDAAATETGDPPTYTTVTLPPDSYLSDLVGCRGADCFYAALAYDRLHVCDDLGCQPIVGAPMADGDLRFATQPFCVRTNTPYDQTAEEPPTGNDADAASAAPPGRVTLAAYDDNSVQTWDVSDPLNPILSMLLQGQAGVENVLMREDCAVLGTVADTGGALYDATNGAFLAQTAIEPGDARQLYNIGSGIGIASANRDDAIRLWGFARTGDSEPLWRGGDRDARSISPDGGWAVTMSGNAVTLTNLATRESAPLLLGSAVGDALLSDTAEDLLLGPQGAWLLWRAFDGSARLMDAGNGAELGRIEEAPQLSAAALAANRLALAGSDGVVRLWDMGDPAALDVTRPITFSQQITDVEALALSLDGRWLAISGKGHDDRVRLWDTTKFTPGGTLPIITDARALALSENGAQLAVMHEDPDGSILPTRVTIWDTVSGQKLAELGVTEARPALAFDAEDGSDGEEAPLSLIVAHGSDGVTTIHRHFITTTELAHRAAQVAGCRLETEADRALNHNAPLCEDWLLRQLREEILATH